MKIRGIIFFSLIVFSVFASSVHAAMPSLVPAGCQGDANISECGLTQVEELFANVAQIILGVAGSLTLAMFVYGGIMYMVSSGDSGKVKKATEVLKTTVIGLALILFAGTAIKILLKVLAGA